MTTTTYPSNLQSFLSMRFYAIEEQNSQPKEFTPITTNTIVFPYKIRIQITNYSDKEKTLGFIFCNNVQGLNLKIESLHKISAPIDQDRQTTIQKTTIPAYKTTDIFISRVTKPIGNDQSASFKIIEKSRDNKGILHFSANFNTAETLKKQLMNFGEFRSLDSEEIPHCYLSQTPSNLLPVKAAFSDEAKHQIPLVPTPKVGYFFRNGLRLLLENQSYTDQQVAFLFKEHTCGLHLGFTINNIDIPAKIERDEEINFTYSCQKATIPPRARKEFDLVRKSQDLINDPASQLEILLIDHNTKKVKLIGKALFQLNLNYEQNDMQESLHWLKNAQELQYLKGYSAPSISPCLEELPFDPTTLTIDEANGYDHLYNTYRVAN